MKNVLIGFTLAAAQLAPALAADTYRFDPETTIPAFEVEHLGFTTQRGRFNKAEGKIVLDRAAKQGSVELTIYTSSLDMGSPSWTAHLSDEGLFNVAKYPTMTYKSDHLIFDGEAVVGAEGTLTMLGVTKPVFVHVTGFKCVLHPDTGKRLCGGDVSATVKRSEFGMTKYLREVSDAVKIDVPVEAYKE